VLGVDVEHLAGFQRDCERQARQALGETAFQAAYHRGLELPAEDALAYALQQPPEEPPKRPSVPAVPGGALLTPRELQVGRLLARGCSNKEIAAELVISPRTAEGHVERILTKLGFTSRAQVAAWVAASQPDVESRLAAPRFLLCWRADMAAAMTARGEPRPYTAYLMGSRGSQPLMVPTPALMGPTLR
jgi:DNA-binding CsgD family transcriptional regulator